MRPEPLFYITQTDNTVAGPYDLVQMAGLLRKQIITEETLTCLKGEKDWKPFGRLPQFAAAREVPPGAVSKRVEKPEKRKEEPAVSRAPLPLPSARALMTLGGLLCGVLLAGAGAFLIAGLGATTGYCLMLVGFGAALGAQGLIVSRVLGEHYLTFALVLFVPFGDIFYFICNIQEYVTWFGVKYAGAAVCAGAAMGMAAPSGH